MSAALDQLRHQLSAMASAGGSSRGVKAAALEALGVTIGTGPAIASGAAPTSRDHGRSASAPIMQAAAPDIQTARDVEAVAPGGAQVTAPGGAQATASGGMQAAAAHSLAAVKAALPGAVVPAFRQRPGHEQAPASAGWSFAGLGGRFVELSAGWNSAALTLAISLVWQAQRAEEPTAWIMGEAGGFFPPDAAANGVDLAALAVVRIPENDAARVPYTPAQVRDNYNAAARAPGNDTVWTPGMWAYSNNAAKAAGRLVRSGAFGLIVLDLGVRARIAPALQSSLVQQAQRHGTAIVCLTEKPPRSASLGTLVALRGQARRERRGEDSFACALEIVKDKRRGPGWMHEEEAHGPPGLR